MNQEADKKEQEPAFAPDTESKDVEIDYKDPQPDPKDHRGRRHRHQQEG